METTRPLLIALAKKICQDPINYPIYGFALTPMLSKYDMLQQEIINISYQVESQNTLLRQSVVEDDRRPWIVNDSFVLASIKLAHKVKEMHDLLMDIACVVEKVYPELEW